MPELPLTPVGIAVEDAALRERAATACADAGVPVVLAEASIQVLLDCCVGGLPAVVIVDGEIDELPDTGVVEIGRSTEGHRARKALNHGIDGFVTDESIETALAATVRAVAAGQICLPREQRKQLGASPLSYRERQAIGMVVMGFTNAEIARRLYLAESTIKSHLSSAFRKLGVRSRAEAAALVLDPAAGVGVGILTIPQSDGVASNGRGSASALSG